MYKNIEIYMYIQIKYNKSLSFIYACEKWIIPGLKSG